MSANLVPAWSALQKRLFPRARAFSLSLAQRSLASSNSRAASAYGSDETSASAWFIFCQALERTAISFISLLSCSEDIALASASRSSAAFLYISLLEEFIPLMSICLAVSIAALAWQYFRLDSEATSSPMIIRFSSAFSARLLASSSDVLDFSKRLSASSKAWAASALRSSLLKASALSIRAHAW